MSFFYLGQKKTTKNALIIMKHIETSILSQLRKPYRKSMRRSCSKQHLNLFDRWEIKFQTMYQSRILTNGVRAWKISTCWKMWKKPRDQKINGRLFATQLQLTNHQLNNIVEDWSMKECKKYRKNTGKRRKSQHGQRFGIVSFETNKKKPTAHYLGHVMFFPQRRDPDSMT